MATDRCVICNKLTAPVWLGVKDGQNWCICTRQLNPSGGLWDHHEEMVVAVDSERQKIATALYVERLISKVEIGQRLKDTKHQYVVRVIDKIPNKELLLCLMPTGKTKWCKAPTIANLRVITAWDRRKEK